MALGANKPHPLAKVHGAFKKVAGAEWYGEWAETEKRNKETGLDADGRFVQNLRVLQRTADYGLKLMEVGKLIIGSRGAVIDIRRDGKGALSVALNLDSDAPLKSGRSENRKKATPKAAKASVTPQGATGGKRKVKGAAKRKTAQKAARTPRKATGAE